MTPTQKLIEAAEQALIEMGFARKYLHIQQFDEGMKALAGALAAAKQEQQGEPVVAWVRFRSDGAYEGPIMDSQMEDVRKKSGAWTPLVALQQAAQPAPEVPSVPHPMPEPMTSTFNWFPALSAIVEIWKTPRDYKPGALDEMIDSARVRIDEWQLLASAPSPAQTNQRQALQAMADDAKRLGLDYSDPPAQTGEKK